MKMKRGTTIYLAAAILCGNAAAAFAEAPEINVTKDTVYVENGRLEIRLDIDAREIDLRSREGVRLDVSVDGPESRLMLPAVVYQGTQRYRLDGRDASLSGLYRVPPYKIYKGSRVDESYRLDYDLSIPFQEWMGDAYLSYTMSEYGCRGDQVLAAVTLIGPLSPAPAEPEPWRPDPAVYRRMVCFLEPQVERKKNRSASVELHIDYPVNVSEVRPAFGNNENELSRADTIMYELLNNELINIDWVNITGFASPEGSYRANEQLAQRRAQSFARYLRTNYRLKKELPVSVNWVAEDWDGLTELIRSREMAYKAEILEIIETVDAPDARERRIAQIDGGNPYREMLKNLFPGLRRIELKAGYTVAPLSDERARELIFTDPEMLSLEEMRRVANYYEPGTEEYLRIYTTSAHIYPDDAVANNNAAAAHLIAGDVEGAYAYLNRIKQASPETYLNLGTYYYIAGDLERAYVYFRMAQETGMPQAGENLRLHDGGNEEKQ